MRPHIEAQHGSWDADFQAAKFADVSAIAGHQIILLNGMDIGCLHTDEFSDHIRLYRIWLLPEYQNQGLGSQVLESLINRADELGLPLKLTVLRSNPAKQLYERLGFSVKKETDSHYEMRREVSSD